MDPNIKWQMPPAMIKQEAFDPPASLVSFKYGVSYTSPDVLRSADKDLTVELQDGTKCSMSKIVFAAASEKYRSNFTSNPDIDSLVCDLTEEEFKLAERFMLEGWIPESELEVATRACSLLGINMLDVQLQREPRETEEKSKQLVMVPCEQIGIQKVESVPVVSYFDPNGMEEEDDESVVGDVDEDDFEFDDEAYYEEQYNEEQEEEEYEEEEKGEPKEKKRKKSVPDTESRQAARRAQKKEQLKRNRIPDHARVPGCDEDMKLPTFHFMCVFCLKGFESKASMIQHRPECKKYDDQLSFGNKGDSTCDICNEVHANRVALKEHAKTHKRKQVFLECPHCGMVGDKPSLRAHFREMGNQHNCYCVQCTSKISTYSEYVKHVETEHLGFWKYHCGICLHRFDNQEQVLEHMKLEEHPKSGTCQKCFLEFTALQAHYRQVHGEKKFKCSFEKCLVSKYAYSTPQELQFHTKYNHTSKFPCDLCDQTFGKITFLKVHIERKHKTQEENQPKKVRGRKRKTRAEQEMFPTQIRVPGCDEQMTLPRFGTMCVFCHIGLGSKDDLFQHRKVCQLYNEELSSQRNGEGARLICDSCNIICASDAALEQHLEKQHKDCIFLECPHCGFVADKVNLRRHFREMGNEHNVYCVQCSFKINTYAEHVNHVDEEHNGTWMYHCGECLDRFGSQREVMEHMKVEEHPKKGKCRKCNIEVQTNVQAHYRRVHGPKKFWCDDCPDARFSTIKDYEYHCQCQHGRQYSCEFCAMSFGKKYSLKVHIQLNHTKDEEMPLQCRFCQKGFVDAHKLEPHENTHLNLKPHVCHECGKAFASKNNLHAHLKSHDPMTKYQTKRNKNDHQKIRSYEKYLEEIGMEKQKKSYFCKLCNTSYTGSHASCAGPREELIRPAPARTIVRTRQRGKLSRSMPVVEIQEPFNPRCTLCSAVLANRKALALHMAVHNIPR